VLAARARCWVNACIAPGFYSVRSDGSGEAQRLTDGKLNEQPYSFSPDGKRLAFAGNGNGGSQDIFTAPIEGDAGHLHLGKPELFLGTPFFEFHSAFSSDGRWLAYASSESRILEVYVPPFPGPGTVRDQIHGRIMVFLGELAP
jgi:Tol biopolymer transport system component